jgi:diguanylate cyclase (GGDEF)-like protein/putative nucleotidyltransferase with HDIG domain
VFDTALNGTPELDRDAPEPLIAAVRETGKLPVLDRTVMRVVALCRDEESSTVEIIAMLEHDSAFAANLLRFANSAHAARPVRVRTVRQAVMMAGREQIARLCMEAATCRFLERAAGNGRVSAGLMQVHASAVASCALELAQRTGAAADVAHLAGLLHDVGKLIMPLAFGTATLDAIAAVAAAGPERVALEREQLGCDHALAGAVLARYSGVDAGVADAIMHHHSPDVALTPEAACVQVANALVGMLMGTDPDRQLLDAALSSLRLTREDLDEVIVHAGQLGGGPTAPVTGGELATRIAALEREAATDELTGLANRRAWKERARALIEPGVGAVMLCDVDRFKQVNDRNGHAVGDLVLSEVGRILSRHGLAGRLGGDELVLLTPVAHDRVPAVAEMILTQVRDAFGPDSIEGWQPGISIGIALITGPGRDVGTLLGAADDALYEAKRSGRGRAQIAASPSLA